MSKFGELIDVEIPVLFEFFTEWSDESEAMHDVLRDVAAAMGDKARVIKIDVDKNPAIADQLGIRGVPTLIYYKNGKQLWRKSGVIPLRELETLTK